MKQYIGIKLVNSKPMTRQEYNDFRGWTVPEDENPADAGYLIETIGGQKNTDTYEGYVQWLPTGQFIGEYRELSGLPFSIALDAAMSGHRITREGWNGKDLSVRYMAGGVEIEFDDDDNEIEVGQVEPFFVIYKGNTHQANTWVASVSDMTAQDWIIL